MSDERRTRVGEALPEGVQALLVTTPANVRYLTGFTGSNGQLLLASESVFFTDGRYTTAAAEQVPDLARAIYSGTTKFNDLLGKALADRGITRLAVEANHMTLATGDKLREDLSGIELVPTKQIVEKVRVRKDAAEIEAIRRAQRVAEEALVSCLKAFRGGTEADLALEIELAMRKLGAEAPSFDTIVATGPHSALPHATPRPVDIDVDGVLLVDMGAKVDGYCSDMTRTFLGPEAPVELRSVHDAVVAALEAACAAVRPGVRCADVDAAARDVLSQARYGELFVHGTGHGVGLEIHEGPTLGLTSEDVLEPGMIVTVEPGVYMPGVGGVRVEDFLVVTQDGAENLTSLARGPELPR